MGVRIQQIRQTNVDKHHMSLKNGKKRTTICGQPSGVGIKIIEEDSKTPHFIKEQ